VDFGDLTSAPLLFALSAGMLATINPCGFVMLPAFVSYQLGEREAGYDHVGLGQRLWRALALGLVVTLGFVVVFAGVGLVLAGGGRALLTLIPWVGLLVGVSLVGLGISFLIGRKLVLPLPSVGQGAWARDVRSRFLFGIGYALASLGCTLPIFLAVLAGALASEGVASAAGAFVAYALGMGLVLTVVALGAGLVRGAVAHGLKSAGRYVEQASAVLLVGAGIYLVGYYSQVALVFSR
jgi:cytochrome c-type biogenesis protein